MLTRPMKKVILKEPTLGTFKSKRELKSKAFNLPMISQAK